jgi:hypothetical protein
MKTYTCRVCINRSTGAWADIPFNAISLGLAIQMIEAQYGSGAFMGMLRED